MKRLIITLLVLSFFISVYGETVLNLNDILSRIAENNIQLKAGEFSLEQAEIARQLVEAGRGTQLDASLGPAYKFSKSGSGDSENTSHTINPGISFSRSLPTGGSVSMGLSDSFSLRSSGDGSAYSMNPGFNASVSQPLFTNGKFIDKRLYSAAYDQAGNNKELRTISLTDTQNTLIISGVETFFRIALLRDQIKLKDREIELETKRRLQEEKLQDKGRATSKDVWEKRLEIGRLMDEKWQLEYNLKQSENRMAVLLDSDEDFAVETFDDSIPEIPLGSAFFTADSLVPEVMSGNSGIRGRRISLENTRLSGIVNDTSGAVLSLSADVSPVIPSSDSFSGVFSGMGDEDASLDYSIGFSVSIPLYSGGRDQLQDKSDAASLNSEEEQLRQTVREALNTLDELLLNRKMLEQKLILAGDNLDFSRRHHSDSEYYYKMGQLTEADVAEAGIAADGQEIYQRQAEVDLYLNYLLILDHVGNDLTEFTGE